MPRAILEMFPLPWERVLWSAAPPVARGTDYVLTDFRITVRKDGVTLHEMALDDIARVRLEQRWYQRPAALSTVHIFSRLPGRSIAIRNLRQGPELALILQVLASDDLAAQRDREFVQSALAAGAPRVTKPNLGLVVGATVAFVLAFVVVGIARHNTLAPIAYASDDPIAPSGHKRSTRDIAAFMEASVMPFARRALAPLAGGADKVTCTTCHGDDAAARHWAMPGVHALPEPNVREAGMERTGLFVDPQVRNAVYGYLAEEDKLPIAAYMREVVMPGMAAVMRRPAYDFTQPYSYNRARVAVGCYHCHQVR